MLVLLISALPIQTASSKALYLPSWTATQNIPTSGPYSCVISGGNIYCVGGGLTKTLTYYATESSTGVGSWTAGNKYHAKDYPPACVTDQAYVYCVGGNTSSSAVYSASLSSSGFGSWTLSTNSYPISIALNACVTANDYIYCFGGNSGGTVQSAVYYASLSAGTVGTWNSGGNSYPKSAEDIGCGVVGATVTCAGGNDGANDIGFGQSYSATLTITSPGVSTWTSGVAFPWQGSDYACGTLSVYVYCINGLASKFSSPIIDRSWAYTSTNGAAWVTGAAAYPSAIAQALDGCPSDGVTIFCVGGWNKADLSTGSNLVYYTAPAFTSGGIKWQSSAAIPTAGAYSCAYYSSYIYCVTSDASGHTYYASTSGGAIRSWLSTTSYPLHNLDPFPPACVENGGYITCVGGGQKPRPKADVYYAQLSSSGIGTWTNDSSHTYPKGSGSGIALESCKTYSGYIYCIAGWNGPGNPTNADYYAQLRHGAIVGGGWTSTTSYPYTLYNVGCAVQGSTMVCVGGYDATGQKDVSNVYTATLSTTTGIGTWTAGASYPVSIHDLDCALGNSSSRIYCMGGDLFTGSGGINVASSTVYVSNSGGAWTAQQLLPSVDLIVNSGGCTSDGTKIWCVGGVLDEVLGSIGFWNSTNVWNTVGTVAGTPTIDGTNTQIGARGSKCTALLTTTQSNDVIIANVGIADAGSVSSISDGSSLTWHQRIVKAFTSVYSGGTHNEDVEEWYANAANSLSSDNITFHLTGTSGVTTCAFYGVHGAYVNTPFDPNPGVPQSASSNTASTSGSVIISTSLYDDLAITFVWAPATATVTLPSGFTQVTLGTYSYRDAYEGLSSPQYNLQITWTFGSSGYGIIADALAPTGN